MTYKNWDDVRDHRIYAYLNREEFELFLAAMQHQQIKQKATAARTFIVERSQHIVSGCSAYHFPASNDIH